MAITAKKLTETVKTQYSTPLFVAAGATDKVVEQLRTLPTQAKELQGKLVDLRTSVDVKEIPAKAKSYAETLNGKTVELVNELSTRGETLVKRIRRQQATVDAKAQVKSTVTRAKATKTSATKAVTETVEAVEAAAAKIG